jgi:hypothetical protein
MGVDSSSREVVGRDTPDARSVQCVKSWILHTVSTYLIIRSSSIPWINFNTFTVPAFQFLRFTV